MVEEDEVDTIDKFTTDMALTLTRELETRGLEEWKKAL